ncbi:MAG: lactate dehydrogenase [Hyphomicrobium sp.]|jgi:hypothetical protein|uniref:class I SAM-dependent DNA methyltransferase n=1 Tax=Hyphomicrobium sp. TaxID=82 RepID=UPI0025C03E8C|nr:DNA methyltransferase [Hyphomicrobium sp.]MBX9861142.1 lactate dehydrogenase [Hyphomicrobium sp.]
MNAVEIEEAVSALALAPFERTEFPFAFLAAFGNKETAIQRLRSGNTNQSDIPGGVLQRNHIHLATCDPGHVGDTLTALRTSPRNAKGKPKFVLATDGIDLEAEELATGEVVACKLPDLVNHFGFFLPLAGISTVAEIKNNPIDIKATSRLNKLYVELLKENPDWGAAGRRQELNQFMARLIFCFFAEDTGIFNHQGMFTACIKQMTTAESSNTHEVITELFRVMDTKPEDRAAKRLPAWAKEFPYVNGGLFTHKVDSPRFSKIARSYLVRAGELDWKQINPDIFGSMIQAVADDDERGELGMHYTSVPNILKVLDPLFLDDLREDLEKAEDNPRKLLNLRKRIATIRVFDPACGSGNFLVIAYIKLREIEAEIVKRRKDEDKKSWIKLTNFYGIEMKSFAAEVARLSLLIAEFQCNVRLIGQREACLEVLPLNDTGKIVTGNALRLDWLEVCPPPTGGSAVEEDLSGPTGRMALDGKEPEVETYICGNPPYVWGNEQSNEQKEDLKIAFAGRLKSLGSIDYVAGWFIKGRDYISAIGGLTAFVATNSLNQGRQVSLLWPLLLSNTLSISFAHTSFKWSNLASHKAGVTVSVIGYGATLANSRFIYSDGTRRETANISPYLVPGPALIVQPTAEPISHIAPMGFGSMPNDGGGLLLDREEAIQAITKHHVPQELIRRLVGSQELIDAIDRRCIWAPNSDIHTLEENNWLYARFRIVESARQKSTRPATRRLAEISHRFGEVRQAGDETIIAVPAISSENREYLPFDTYDKGCIITNRNYGIYNAPLWNAALVASRMHWVWMGTVCGRLEMRFSYTNTLGWNTFPVPPLTENQKADLTRCAEDILLAREHYWPATIADMYDPERMDKEFQLVRQAHEKNDETLERIYIGRRFKNDTERLEKLFDMYTKMTAAEAAKAPKKNGRKSKSSDESPTA